MLVKVLAGYDIVKTDIEGVLMLDYPTYIKHIYYLIGPSMFSRRRRDEDGDTFVKPSIILTYSTAFEHF